VKGEMASTPLFLVGLSLVLATADATLVSSRPALDAPGNHERCNCRALRTANFRLASQLRRERREHATELASLRRAIHEMQRTGIPPRKHKRKDQNTLVAHRSTIGTNHAARSISPTVPMVAHTVVHTVAHPGRSGARELLQPDLEQLRSCSQADIEQLVGSPPEDVLEAVNTLLISNVQCGLCIVNCATSVPDFQTNIRNTLSMVRSRRNHGIVAATLIICLCVCAAAHLYMELWTSARAPLRSFRDR
jgi:hypothetical protein